MNVQPTKVICSKCGRQDGISATYLCLNKHGEMWARGPQPAGIPYVSPCPGCGKEAPYIEYTCTHCEKDLDSTIDSLIAEHARNLSRLQEWKSQRAKEKQQATDAPAK